MAIRFDYIGKAIGDVVRLQEALDKAAKEACEREVENIQYKVRFSPTKIPDAVDCED